jgi:hypothetical protein
MYVMRREKKYDDDISIFQFCKMFNLHNEKAANIHMKIKMNDI